MKQVLIHTDGSSKGNPGPGGYGAILEYEGHEKEVSGGYRETTNNRMELMAAIVALEALKEPCQVTLYSDSQYLVESMVKGWAKRWRENGWRRNQRQLAENHDLWETLLRLCDLHTVQFKWVRGHSGDVTNERCHELATRAADEANLPADQGYEARGRAIIGQWWAALPPADSPTSGRLQAIRNRLRSPDPQVRKKALWSAVEEEITALAPDLMDRLDRETDPTLAGWSAWALGRLNCQDAYLPLVNCLGHRSKEARMWAAWALGELGLSKAEAPLRRAMGTQQSNDVAQAIGGALKKLRFESTRVHRRQVAKALRPPPTQNPALLLMVEQLEELEWPVDSEKIVEIRRDMKRLDPGYFDSYMDWTKRKPAIIAALGDDDKVFS